MRVIRVAAGMLNGIPQQPMKAVMCLPLRMILPKAHLVFRCDSMDAPTMT